MQVSGGNADTLKPGLNIIGGMQPRGFKTFIVGIPGEPGAVVIAEWELVVPVNNLVIAVLMDMSIVMSCMSGPLMRSVVGIPDTLGISDAAGRGIEAVACSSGSIPSPGPA